jgi:hypothetical protein
VTAKLIDEFRSPVRSILTMAKVVPCDVRCLEATAVTVDALARLQLAALRAGCRISLHNASPELLELICFIGLEEVIPRDEDRNASR